MSSNEIKPENRPETGVRVLVAEDNPSVRDFITRSLASAGHKVASVGDGQQALDALAREKFDVLVTDIVMPNVDGIALALKADDLSQFGNGLPLKDLSRGQLQANATCPRDDLDGLDRVATKFEEVVIDADFLHLQQFAPD